MGNHSCHAKATLTAPAHQTCTKYWIVLDHNREHCTKVTGRLQLAAILVYFSKQAKIRFVIRGGIGSAETTKIYMIWYNVYITKQNIES